MAVQLEFNTDFTRYLLSEEIHHTVKVVTENDMITCSGAILSQHSSVLHKMVTEDDELFLLNFSDVRECLLVLHGGSVDLTFDNIQDIMKFSVQFEIPLIYQQCMDWIEENVHTENFMAVFNLCHAVYNFSAFLGTTLHTNVYCHCEQFIKMQGPAMFEELHIGDVTQETQETLLRFIVRSSELMPVFLSLVTRFSCKENILMLMSLFDGEVIKAFKYCTKDQMNALVAKMDGIEMDLNCSKAYKELKHLLLQEFCSSAYVVTNILPNANNTIKELIIKDKLWKNMTSDQLILAQTLFDDANHFIFSEIIVAWVSEKMPTREVFSELTKAIVPHQLDADYITLTNSKFRALGYSDIVSPALISRWNLPHHHITNTTVARWISNSGFQMSYKVVCRDPNSGCNIRDGCKVQLHISKSDNRNPSVTYAWHGKDSFDIHTCPTNNGATDIGLYFYGAGRDNAHLPFTTDFAAAVIKAKADRTITVGCLPTPQGHTVLSHAHYARQ